MVGRGLNQGVVAQDLGLPKARVASAGRVSAAAVVYASAASYAIVFALAASLRHVGFGTARFDLGNMTQAVWNTAHGRFLEVTDFGGAQASRLGAHVDPLLALFAPLWWLAPSPIVLLVVQAAAVASGALPTFWLARRYLANQRAAAFIALGYLAYPATQWNAFTPLSNFHPASFAVPLVMFAVWYLAQDRLVPFSVVALLAGSTKEHMPLAIGLLGVWYAVEHRQRLRGASIVAVGATASALNMLVVIPAFSVEGSHPLGFRYEQFGDTPAEIVVGVLTNPATALATAATGSALLYLGLLFVPFLGLWVRAPLLLLGALPELALDLLSNDPNQTSIAYHYSAGVAPFVVAAAIVGASRLRFDAERVAFATLAAVAVFAMLSPLVLMGPQTVRDALPSNELRQARLDAVGLVPPDARVSATNALGAHLSARRTIYTFPVVRDAEWVVVDRSDDDYLATGGPTAGDFRELMRDPGYRLVSARKGVLVFQRVDRPNRTKD